MTTVSLRFDDNTKKELDEMCAEMGMNLTTFFMIYAKKALRERKIPFMVDAPLKIDEMIIMMIKHLSNDRCFLSFIRVKNPHKNALKRHKNHMDNIALLC